jgi:hypothetical protein
MRFLIVIFSSNNPPVPAKAALDLVQKFGKSSFFGNFVKKSLSCLLMNFHFHLTCITAMPLTLHTVSHFSVVIGTVDGVASSEAEIFTQHL